MSPRRCCDDGVRCQSGVCAIARSILLQLYAMTGWTTDDGGIIIVASPVPHSPHGSECPVGALPALRSDNLARRSAATLANAPATAQPIFAIVRSIHSTMARAMKVGNIARM